MIEKYKDLIHLIDARKGIPPILESKIVAAYLDVFGKTDDFKGYIDCKCPSYVKLFYTDLKKELLNYERGVRKDK